MTTTKELNKKIESLTKEVKDLQESRAKADDERSAYQHIFINLPVTINT